jgi:hypothetical protein
MPFRLSLYRAPEGLGPLDTWECEHRDPLGTREELKAALERVFGRLSWDTRENMLCASSPFATDPHAGMIWLFGEPGEMLLEISVYGTPPPIRAIMSNLGLNYCYAQESGELYRPFEAGDHWSSAAL